MASSVYGNSPTYTDVWQYANLVQGVSQEAREAFLEAAKNVDFSDWAVAAEQLREIIVDIVDLYGNAAGALGAQWYEYCRSMKYDSGYFAIVSRPNRYSVKSDCDNVIDKLFRGEITAEAMIASLAGVVVGQVQKHSRNVVEDNLDIEYWDAIARGDYTSKIVQRRAKPAADEIGYARVPTSANPCAFCVMLASRGFVYSSEEKATKSRKTGDKYHSNCFCKAVPFFKAGEIVGYGEKLDEYWQQYDDARTLWKSGNMPQDLKDRINDAREIHEYKYEHDEEYRKTHDKWSDDNAITIVMRWQDPKLH